MFFFVKSLSINKKRNTVKVEWFMVMLGGLGWVVRMLECSARVRLWFCPMGLEGVREGLGAPELGCDFGLPYGFGRGLASLGEVLPCLGAQQVIVIDF